MPLGSTHSLDFDGASSHLYYCLAKEHFRGGGQGAQLESARVNIPSTVLFEQGFAKAWFSSVKSHDGPNLQVKRKLARDVSNCEIYDIFTKNAKHDNDIAATFISSQKKDVSDPGQGGRLVQYFTKKGLREFLSAPGQKPKGILQKFAPPKGTNNCTIKAVWSQRVTIAEGWRNATPINQCNKSPFERAATVEEPSLGNQVVVTSPQVAAIRVVCSHIVHHLFLVEHVRVVGMVLLFKVDTHDSLRLLYSLSMRVQTDSGLHDYHGADTPLNLSVKFQSYDKHMEEEKERIADEQYRQSVASRRLPNIKNPPRKEAVTDIAPLSGVWRRYMREKNRAVLNDSSVVPEKHDSSQVLKRRWWRGVSFDVPEQVFCSCPVPAPTGANLPRPEKTTRDPAHIGIFKSVKKGRLLNMEDYDFDPAKKVSLPMLHAPRSMPFPVSKTSLPPPLLHGDDASNIDGAETLHDAESLSRRASSVLDDEGTLTFVQDMIAGVKTFASELLYSAYSHFLTTTDDSDFKAVYPLTDLVDVLSPSDLDDMFARCGLIATQNSTSLRVSIPRVSHEWNQKFKTHDAIQHHLDDILQSNGWLYKRVLGYFRSK